jgi:aminoglycoside 3-N-acetyltransferase I
MPSPFTINQLTHYESEQFARLVNLFHIVFENEQPTVAPLAHLQRLLSDPHFAVFVVVCENQLVGGCTAYVLPSYTSTSAELLIYDLAIHPDFQRRGLGTLLIQTVRTYCTNQHIPLYFALAHADDEPAVEFYRASGAQLESVMNALYPIS